MVSIDIKQKYLNNKEEKKGAQKKYCNRVRRSQCCAFYNTTGYCGP